MKNLLYTLTVPVLLVAMTACSEDEPYEYGDFRFDMVTFSGYDDSSRASFTLLQRDDSQITLLTTAR